MEELYWIALRSVPQVGNVTFRRLIEHFGSPKQALSASERDLSAVRGITSAAIAALLRHDPHKAAEQEYRAVRNAGACIVTLHDPDYPQLLRHLPDPPPYLYAKGQLRNVEPTIAIVGSRRASAYGLATTEKFTRDLTRNGIAVVSGMARGIDATAHRASILEGGYTIGVLGCGIDVIYPRENKPLYHDMAAQGALLSEFPMGTLPLAENFPRRNRIISGIASAVLVIEAAEGSGSLITAQCALEQGRDIFAIPGAIHTPNSRGTNRLIKDGAILVESVADILAELAPRSAIASPALPAPLRSGLSPKEAAVYSVLSSAPLHIDDIVVKCALTVGEVSAILLRFELDGIVTQLVGKQFSIL
jgi:DNA processing protein